jgi:hypothetical protein
MCRPWLIIAPLLVLAACSGTVKKEGGLYGAGEKATVGPLVYNVVDSQITPSLGDDPANLRTPQNRFVIVEVSVSNSSNQDVSIPAMTLVDDSGQTFPELADGRGVNKWLGVIRKVAPAETEEGNVLFDAPARHYRLRLTGEGEPEISIDLPLNFVHEQIKTTDVTPQKEN